jgi:zinc transport system substrate-binding protein
MGPLSSILVTILIIDIVTDMKQRSLAIAMFVLLPAVAACSNSTSSPPAEKLSVSVALYPIAEIVQRVGGDSVEVVNLTPPGTDAHDVELTAKQVQRLEESDVTFYFGDDFQPSTQKAVQALRNKTVVDLFESVELLDATLNEAVNDNHNHDEEKNDNHNHDEEKEADKEDAHNHGEHDPHVWLDPANMIAMTKTVVSTLSKVEPEKADAFSQNGDKYIAELTELGEFLDSKIGIPQGGQKTVCADPNLVTAHQGFTYLAHRAGLSLIPIAGINPDEQVSAKYVEQLSATLKGKNVTIFYESLISSSAADALAASVNAKTDVLNPVEGVTEEDITNGLTYISAQRDNITKIATALRCS